MLRGLGLGVEGERCRMVQRLGCKVEGRRCHILRGLGIGVEGKPCHMLRGLGFGVEGKGVSHVTYGNSGFGRKREIVTCSVLLDWVWGLSMCQIPRGTGLGPSGWRPGPAAPPRHRNV